jgi:hypothetical protein
MMMIQQQDKKTTNEPIKPPVVNNSTPQAKVFSDIVPEAEKSLLIKPNDQLLNVNDQPKENIEEVKQVNDFNVLTAAPVVVANNDGANSILLGMEDKKPFNWFFIFTPILLLTFAGFAVAFYGGFLPWPFWGLTQQQVIEKMFDTIPSIRSGRYGIDINFKSETRQSGVKGYDLSSMLGGVGNNVVATGAVARDEARFNAISGIENALDLYKKENGKYPQFLNDIRINNPELLLDPATKNQYGYRQEKGGTDFTLHVQMETNQGINSYRTAVLVIPSATLQTNEDKLAVVHADTPKIKKQSIVSVVDGVKPAYDPTIVLQNLPSEIDASLRFAGLAQLENSNGDALVDIDGSLKLSGMSFSAGFGVIKKGGMTYGKVKEAPSLGFFDLAGIKNKWIKLEMADLNKVGFVNAEQKLRQENQTKYLLIAKKYLQILKEEKVLNVIKELPKEKNKDGTFYRYSVSIDSDKTAVIYERLNEEIKNQFGINYDIISDDFIAYMRGPKAATVNKLSQQNSQMEIWIDAKNFWPYKFISNSVFVPPDNIEKLKEKQYRAQVSFDLFDVNKPVVIEAPVDSISISDAEKLVVGK